MNGLSFSVQRAGLIARVTFIEATRQRLSQFLLLVAAGLVVGAQALQAVNFGLPELKFLMDLGFGAMVFFGSILTIAAGAQLFFSEIDHRTVLTVLAKPVGRTEFLAGKWLGLLAVVTLFCAVMTALIVAVLWARESALIRAGPEFFALGGRLRYADILAVGFAHWLGFGVLSVLTLLVASLAQTQLHAVMISFGVLAICHLQYLAQEAYAHAGMALHLLAGFIALLFPNFQVFNLGELPDTDEGIGIALLARVTGYALCYLVVGGALAAFSFKRREI
jgi:ABC-type transport system involved in multi-copper enzyme maturation permease subunit